MKRFLLVFLSFLPIRSIAIIAGEKLRDSDHHDFEKNTLRNKVLFEYCALLFDNKNKISSADFAYQKINESYPDLNSDEKDIKFNEIVNTLIENKIISIHNDLIILTGNPSGYKTE